MTIAKPQSVPSDEAVLISQIVDICVSSKFDLQGVLYTFTPVTDQGTGWLRAHVTIREWHNGAAHVGLDRCAELAQDAHLGGYRVQWL